MLKVGITGGIGSGKTTVCQIFEVLGIPVFYADAIAKEVMYADENLRNEIISAFGKASYNLDSSLNRKHIAEIVFNNDNKLETLNALVHPAVFRAFDNWVLKQKAPYVIKEAALLFESGSYHMCDYSILVTAPEAIKILRVIKRDHLKESDVRLRMDRQLDDQEKEKLSDFTVLNDENLLLIPQVLALHEQFIAINPVLA
ncbi:MAG: dephospho-CoA kinase [Flavobacterium sp.]|nr:dephospho-CoA kinase [Pedobacter sp.]